MTVLYTQIKKMSNGIILTGEFSPQTSAMNVGNETLKELRDVTGTLPKGSQEKFYKFDASQDNFIFMIKVFAKGIVISVIVDRYSAEKHILKYLEEVYKEFSPKYSDDPKANYYFFDSTIKSMSDKFNKDNKYNHGLEAVDETKNILAESLNLIIQRKENIDNLNKLASKMSLEAKHMHKNIQKMHLKSMFNDYGVYAVIAFVFLLLLYYIIH